jgi:tetratricopeptide (TPR) repeat protein
VCVLLLAGEQALRRFAAADAEVLLTRCLTAAAHARDPEVQGRALIARAHAREARAAYREAIVDLEEAVAVAREAGDQRLEMVALRALGGEPTIALGLPMAATTAHLQDGLRLAMSLGDRSKEADLLAWLAILASNRLRFDQAADFGRRAVVAARASGDEHALAAALDGRKTSLAYLGEVVELVPVLDELLPLLRRQGDSFRLHWALFEAGFPAVAAGDWARATTSVEQALEVCRRDGLSAYVPWHVAHLGWLARLRGDDAAALELGRSAVSLNEEMPHAWCGAMAAALLGTTLLELGSAAEAVPVLERGRRLAEQVGSEAYLLRCLAPLAQATGDRAVLEDANRMFDSVGTPPGTVWMAADFAYLSLARAWLSAGDPERSRAVLAPMLVVAQRIPWVSPLAEGSLVDARAAAALGLVEEARGLYQRAGEVAGRHRLERVVVTVERELLGLAGRG